MRRPSVAVLVLVSLLAPSFARAEDLQRFYSLSLSAGWAIRNHAASGGVSGLRPEVIVAEDTDRPLVGVGPYVELQRIEGERAAGSDHETLIGGGLTGVIYNRSGFALAGSLGIDGVGLGDGWHPQLAISMFAGFRSSGFGKVDVPVGLRLAAHPGTDAVPATVTGSFSMDLVGVGVGVMVICALLDKLKHR